MRPGTTIIGCSRRCRRSREEDAMTSTLAILGGSPAFETTVPVVRPAFAAGSRMLDQIGAVLESGQVTSGRYVCEFEERAADYLGVGNVVAVSSGTTGLLLTLRCLELDGGVALPSFTFMASGHAAAWNSLTVHLVDCNAETYTIDRRTLRAVRRLDTRAVMPVHTFGTPCDLDALCEEADGLPVVVDAAHALGARYPDGTMVGSKGTAEIFSLSPTKTLSTG